MIWTPKLAYSVGLITTDGNLSPDGRHFDFTSNDRDLIETFKECLNLKNKICTKKSGGTKKNTSFRIQFGDVKLYRWLLTIGLMPNKSKILGPLKIPDKFFFHFLRGHLDGDGSIWKYFDRVYPKSLRLYITFTSASLPHLEWIQSKIQKLVDKKGSLQRGKGVHVLKFSKWDSVALIKNLYKPNVPCLQRKYVLIKEFLSTPAW